MSQTLEITDTLQGGGSLYDTVTDITQRVAFGGVILPAIEMRFSTGTGASQANKMYLERRTLAATTMDLLDLKALTDFQGDALDFVTVRRIVVAIVDPDGTKELRVGPQNQTNALSGFWGGVGATVYTRVWHHEILYRPITGAATSATDKVLAIYNPGASPLDYAIQVLGTNA